MPINKVPSRQDAVSVGDGVQGARRAGGLSPSVGNGAERQED